MSNINHSVKKAAWKPGNNIRDDNLEKSYKKTISKPVKPMEQSF